MILLHELGHLLSARATGIRATAFSLGFGPALWKRRWKGIDWRVGVIMLGGYVRIPAIMPPELERDKQQALDDWTLSEADRQRIEAAGSSGDLYDAMGQISVDERPEQWQRIRDEHAPDAYYLASYPRRTLVILAGSAVNVIGGALLLWISLWLWSPLYQTEWRVSEVSGSTPASLVGERVLQLNDQGLTYSDSRQVQDLDDEAKSHKGKSLLLLEGGKVEYVEPGAATISYRKSSFAGRRDDIKFTSAGADTWTSMKQMVSNTIRVATRTFFDEETRKQTGTVVGAVDKAPDARYFLPQYLAIISIAIGLVNLLPLLPLDGGHFVMSTLRAARVRLHRRAYILYGLAGFAFVMGLFTIGLINDIRAF